MCVIIRLPPIQSTINICFIETLVKLAKQGEFPPEEAKMSKLREGLSQCWFLRYLFDSLDSFPT